jgi:hypothetical protein
MTTQEIAKRVVELNRTGDYETIYRELYAVDAVSIENWGPEPEVYTGLEAIGKKGEAWMADVEEMHETSCSEPLVADGSFAITFTMDITYKSRGREKMTEMAVYTVNDGKIVKEEFQA